MADEEFSGVWEVYHDTEDVHERGSIECRVFPYMPALIRRGGVKYFMSVYFREADACAAFIAHVIGVAVIPLED